MRIRVCSDLHLESKIQPQDVINTQLEGEYDVLVLAGDIVTKTVADACFGLIREKTQVPIVWVLGNHEYWGTRGPMDTTLAFYDEVALAHNVRLLERETIDIMGKTFFGATMWFKENGITPEERRYWADFNYIGNGHPGVPRQIHDLNKKTTDVLNKLEKVDVVVTHHLPSHESVHPAFARSDTNKFFVNEVDPQNMKKVGVWIHGHTHWGSDYVNMHGTRVVCNPYGYDDKLAKAENFCNYKPALTIDV